ncbi:MAG: 2,3-bisphosphoglycerate-independent phosphoglycerate mutase [Spirochaetia bacterium]|nr:2,3-bisphosphoglycerate-independent phosphoglycerate mutase [Spirochaetia bacterium]
MVDFQLERFDPSLNGPVLLIILDGVGIYRGANENYPGNAFDLANTPVLEKLISSAPISTTLKAHGKAVGMPSDDDMGNSEVGHNAMGAGRIFDQGAKLVSRAIESGYIFNDDTWKKFIGTKNSPGFALQNHQRSVHFIGLLSDGNVHSNIEHLFALIKKCHEEGVKNLFVHTLLDGRDVPETSALIYIEKLEAFLSSIDRDYAIASGGGRMSITMDRYEADWDMVERGWKTHVAGSGRMFHSAKEAVETYREENPGIIDQNLPAFVIEKNGVPAGPIQNDDIVIFYNFRGDRSIEISKAFTDKNFAKFKREPDVKVNYAGMMEYDGDHKIPPEYLVNPPSIKKTISEYLVKNQIKQYAISETQKFGHVTYFWNGNNSEKFDETLETWKEIPSDRISFDLKPEMKAREVTDELIRALESGEYHFLRVNFANGDMVGHTGSLKASVKAMEVLDECVDKLIQSSEKCGATVIITADHGNCDQMYEVDKKTGEALKNEDGRFLVKTSHTLNPVPFLITGKLSHSFSLNPEAEDPGLGNLASTILNLLGFTPPSDYLPSIIKKNN